MGGKPRPKDRAWYRRHIRKVNRAFKKSVDASEYQEQLIGLKDRLIDALIAQCSHTSLLESHPEENAFGPSSLLPARTCLLCAETEYAEGEWLVLTGSAELVSRRDFTIRLGLVLKDLGINL